MNIPRSRGCMRNKWWQWCKQAVAAAGCSSLCYWPAGWGVWGTRAWASLSGWCLPAGRHSTFASRSQHGKAAAAAAASLPRLPARRVWLSSRLLAQCSGSEQTGIAVTLTKGRQAASSQIGTTEEVGGHFFAFPLFFPSLLDAEPVFWCRACGCHSLVRRWHASLRSLLPLELGAGAWGQWRFPSLGRAGGSLPLTEQHRPWTSCPPPCARGSTACPNR